MEQQKTEESELIKYLKEKEERERIEKISSQRIKLGLVCSALILAPLLIPKGEGEW